MVKDPRKKDIKELEAILTQVENDIPGVAEFVLTNHMGVEIFRNGADKSIIESLSEEIIAKG